MNLGALFPTQQYLGVNLSAQFPFLKASITKKNMPALEAIEVSTYSNLPRMINQQVAFFRRIIYKLEVHDCLINLKSQTFEVEESKKTGQKDVFEDYCEQEEKIEASSEIVLKLFKLRIFDSLGNREDEPRHRYGLANDLKRHFKRHILRYEPKPLLFVLSNSIQLPPGEETSAPKGALDHRSIKSFKASLPSLRLNSSSTSPRSPRAIKEMPKNYNAVQKTIVKLLTCNALQNLRAYWIAQLSDLPTPFECNLKNEYDAIIKHELHLTIQMPLVIGLELAHSLYGLPHERLFQDIQRNLRHISLHKTKIKKIAPYFERNKQLSSRELENKFKLECARFRAILEYSLDATKNKQKISILKSWDAEEKKECKSPFFEESFVYVGKRFLSNYPKNDAEGDSIYVLLSILRQQTYIMPMSQVIAKITGFAFKYLHEDADRKMDLTFIDAKVFYNTSLKMENAKLPFFQIEFQIEMEADQKLHEWSYSKIDLKVFLPVDSKGAENYESIQKQVLDPLIRADFDPKIYWIK